MAHIREGDPHSAAPQLLPTCCEASKVCFLQRLDARTSAIAFNAARYVFFVGFSPFCRISFISCE